MSIQLLAFRDKLIEAKKHLKERGFCTHQPVCNMFRNGIFYCQDCYYEKYKEMIDNEEIVIP